MFHWGAMRHCREYCLTASRSEREEAGVILAIVPAERLPHAAKAKNERRLVRMSHDPC